MFPNQGAAKLLNLSIVFISYISVIRFGVPNKKSHKVRRGQKRLGTTDSNPTHAEQASQLHATELTITISDHSKHLLVAMQQSEKNTLRQQRPVQRTIALAWLKPLGIFVRIIKTLVTFPKAEASWRKSDSWIFFEWKRMYSTLPCMARMASAWNEGVASAQHENRDGRCSI